MQDYNTIISSIQMRLNGCQTRSVMDRYKIGSGTLNLIMSRYHANGIPIEELRMMAPKEVEDLFYPQKNLQRKDIPLPDFQYYYDRIHTPGSCKLRSNGMPVPLLRNCYSIFNGTKYR